MEQLAGLAKNDSSKYKDVINIYLKLQGEGRIRDLSEQIDKVFKHEILFTIDELERIEKARNEKIDIEAQCANNLSLFNTNFQMIVGLLVENSFKAACNNIPQTYKEKINNKEESLKTDPKPLKEVKSKAKDTAKTPKKTQNENHSTKSNIKETTLQKDLKEKNKENNKKTHKPATSYSASKASSNLHKILNNGSAVDSTASSFKGKRESMVHEPSKSMTLGVLGNISRVSSIALPSPKQSPNSRSFVQSEFNYITGAASFEQSRRRFLDLKETGPGPSDYLVQTSNRSNSRLRRSISPSIGNANKVSWIDNLTNVNCSPGPSLYPSHHFLSK